VIPTEFTNTYGGGGGKGEVKLTESQYPTIDGAWPKKGESSPFSTLAEKERGRSEL